MNKSWLAEVLLASIVMLVVASSYSYAGSDRWIMAMTAERMDKGNLVFVRFLGPNGAALESDILEKMVIREQDCSSGHVFKMVKDYKMGFSTKNMLVGIYLPSSVWNNKPLCFSVPNLGKIMQNLDPATNNGRSFELKMIP